ncbi:MAG TPA: hypothetical protein VMU69_30040 [Bradyrhizobium sp.]|nr:hypothetical protein [Bradyrhizobium sp.]
MVGIVAGTAYAVPPFEKESATPSPALMNAEENDQRDYEKAKHSLSPVRAPKAELTSTLVGPDPAFHPAATELCFSQGQT